MSEGKHDCINFLRRIPTSDEDGTYECFVCKRIFKIIEQTREA